MAGPANYSASMSVSVLPVIVLCMINELDGIDWSAMSHAYGPADDVPRWLKAMGSADPAIRREAFSDFYSAAHHQGDVYACTTASLPFLFVMADDPTTPDRASVVELLLSIGREAVAHDDGGLYFGPDGSVHTAWADSAAVMRERAGAFVSYAADADLDVRRAAIEGLGLFLDNADRAVEILRGRLPVEPGIVERLLVVRTMADLALRLPTARPAATEWLAALAENATAAPDIRLAALVHHARCAPEALTGDTVPTSIGLLRQLTPMAQTTSGDQACQGGSGGCVCTPATEPTAQGAPPTLPPRSRISIGTTVSTHPPRSCCEPSMACWTTACPSARSCSPNSFAARTLPPDTTRSAWPRT